MSERRWDAIGKKIEPAWGPDRDRKARVAIEARAAGRRAGIRRGAAVLALGLVAAGVGSFVGLRNRAPSATSVIATAAPSVPATVKVTNLSPETVLEPMPDRAGRGFMLRSGGARFVVPHDDDHPFVVIAGDVIIEDRGTTFVAQYVEGDTLEVTVEEGRVNVRFRGNDVDVRAGETRRFAPPPPPSSLDKPSPAVGPSWRPLAESGRYDEARSALKKAGPNAVRDETADLMLAADAARLGGYPAEAVPYLERVVRAHSSDPRSSLASFTLGRVLLDELGRPREAADAFARARAAGGPLAEDALAREVEAASRVGETTKSRDLAREYRSLYPNGRRAKAVSRFGGLD